MKYLLAVTLGVLLLLSATEAAPSTVETVLVPNQCLMEASNCMQCLLSTCTSCIGKCFSGKGHGQCVQCLLAQCSKCIPTCTKRIQVGSL